MLYAEDWSSVRHDKTPRRRKGRYRLKGKLKMKVKHGKKGHKRSEKPVAQEEKESGEKPGAVHEGKEELAKHHAKHHHGKHHHGKHHHSKHHHMASITVVMASLIIKLPIRIRRNITSISITNTRTTTRKQCQRRSLTKTLKLYVNPPSI